MGRCENIFQGQSVRGTALSPSGPPDALHWVLLCGSLLETHALHFTSFQLRLSGMSFTCRAWPWGLWLSVGTRNADSRAPPRHPQVTGRSVAGPPWGVIGTFAPAEHAGFGVCGPGCAPGPSEQLQPHFPCPRSSQGSWGTAPVCPLSPAFPTFTKMPSESTKPSRACSCSRGRKTERAGLLPAQGNGLFP